MKPTLKIKFNNQTIEKIEVDSLKAAVKQVNHYPATAEHSFIFSTINDKNRIENTVTIRQSHT